jgi:hypothetical protein
LNFTIFYAAIGGLKNICLAIPNGPLRDYQRSDLYAQITSCVGLQAQEKEDIITWLHKALKLNTMRDGLSRDGEAIEDHLTRNLQEQYGGRWACIFTNNQNLRMQSEKSIKFRLDNNDFVFIYKR